MNARRHLFRFLAVAVFGTAVASTVAATVTPVQIKQTMEAQFPAALSFSAITSGEARVLINIDAEGHLADLMVTSYTDKAFADEAVVLLKHWRYSPATIDGKPIGVRFEISLNFTSTGRIVSLTALDGTYALTNKFVPTVFVSRLCAPAELDRPVEAIQTVSPFHPGPASASSKKKGVAVLDFYVDEKGMIRMPVVVETTDQIYAEASIDALSHWRFSTPTRKGKPVAVRMQQQFIFPESS